MFFRILVTILLCSNGALAQQDAQHAARTLVESIRKGVPKTQEYTYAKELSERLSHQDLNPVADLKHEGLESPYVSGLIRKHHRTFKQAQQQAPKLNKLLIFVSLSMPTASLKQLDKQAKEIGGLLVLRGLVKDSFTDTAALLSGQGISAVVDPRLFQMYDVVHVPTFVMNPNDEHPCVNRACVMTPRYDKIAGDVTLEYALEQLASFGVYTKEVAEEYLTLLREES